MMQHTPDCDSECIAAAPPVPTELGEYRLLEKLGEGGMGAVYKAVHTRLDKVVALKFLLKTDQADDSAIDRFEREMKAVGRLNHPNLIQAYDAREIDGTRFLVTEYVEGLDLEGLLQRGGPLPIADACELCRQAALGLQAIYEHGMVHRDIKPSNLMLTCQGVVKVLDLGLARARPAAATGNTLTVAGQLMGTPDYMAPEQASDCHAADIRADLYSLGCTLYELLTGEVVFGDPQYKSFIDKAAAHMMRTARPIQELRGEIPVSLAAIIHRMLAKEPGQRFPTPAQVVEALTPFAAGCDLKGWLHHCGVNTTVSNAPVPTPLASEVSLAPGVDTGRRRLAVQILADADRALRRAAVQPGRSSEQPESGLSQRPSRSSRRAVAILALLGVAVVGIAVWFMIPGDGSPAEKPLRQSPTEVSATSSNQPATTTPPAEPKPHKTVAQPPAPPETPFAPAKPALAVAPFDDAQAKQHQKAWAEYLGVPVSQTNSVGMKLVLIPPGEFKMGSTDDERASSSTSGERPSHRVRITRPFLLGACEVTQAEFRSLLGSNPSRFKRGPNAKRETTEQDADRRPVESVSWALAAEFCQRLSALPGEQSAGRVYRLPREAEWEYACRAGSATRWSCDETKLAEHAWFGRPEGKPLPVGQKKPNPWGLYDVHGNVFEWCQDWFASDYYRQSPTDDPSGPTSGLERVIRGGSWWNNSADYCRSAARVGAPLEGSEMIGFRVLCEVRSRSETAGTPAAK